MTRQNFVRIVRLFRIGAMKVFAEGSFDACAVRKKLLNT
jgi:hypothetical protein